MKVLSLFSVFLFFTFSGSQAFARRDVKAHVHGEAELTLVLDGKNLQLEAKIPMNDLVGFEHKPKSQKQKDLWKQASEKLKNATRQLELPDDAVCSLKEADLEDLDHHHEHEHDQHGHHHDNLDKHDKEHKHEKHHEHHDKDHKRKKHGDHQDKHDKNHKHKKHDKHDKDHKHKKHDEHHDDDHADVRVKYLFQCKDPTKVKKIQIKFFKDFPSLKKVSASFVGPKGQGHKQLSSSDNVIMLSK
ncbi:MAG: DUF2796 domain-containing protein [Oligoflexales bacterium]